MSQQFLEIFPLFQHVKPSKLQICWKRVSITALTFLLSSFLYEATGQKENRDCGDCQPPFPKGWRTETWVIGLANGLQCLNIFTLALGLWRLALTLPKGGILNHGKAPVKPWQNTGLANQPGRKQIKIYGQKLPHKSVVKTVLGAKKRDGGGGGVWKVKRKNKWRQNTLSTLSAS